MTTIIEQVHIDAPPERVWAVVKDVERWPDWSPGTRSIKRLDDGPFALGSHAKVTMKGTRGLRWTVTALDEGRSFTWETDMMPGAHIVAEHIVEPRDGGSYVTLTLVTAGTGAAIVAPFLDPFSRKNVKAEAQGLKRLCESSATAAEAPR